MLCEHGEGWFGFAIALEHREIVPGFRIGLCPIDASDTLIRVRREVQQIRGGARLQLGIGIGLGILTRSDFCVPDVGLAPTIIGQRRQKRANRTSLRVRAMTSRMDIVIDIVPPVISEDFRTKCWGEAEVARISGDPVFVLVHVACGTAEWRRISRTILDVGFPLLAI